MIEQEKEAWRKAAIKKCGRKAKRILVHKTAIDNRTYIC